MKFKWKLHHSKLMKLSYR